MNKRSIIFVNETAFPKFKGGVERWFDFLSKSFSEHFDVKVLNYQGENKQINKIEFISLPLSKHSFHLSGKRDLKNIFSFSWSVFKFFLKDSSNVIYCSSYPYLHLFAIKAAKVVTRKKSLLICDWFEYPSKKFWYSEFGVFFGYCGLTIQNLAVKIPHINLVYLDSTEMEIKSKTRKSQLVNRLPGICFPELFELPRPKYGLKSNLCQLGRLTKDKQPILSLQVIARLKRMGWRGKFFLVGNGPLKNTINDEISKFDLLDQVILVEDALDSDVQNIVRSCGAMLHPSKREGFGLAIVEAAFLGVPSILVCNDNNKSVELKINPTLVASAPDSEEIAKLVFLALHQGERYFNECMIWCATTGTNMSAVKSLKLIHSLLLSEEMFGSK